MCETIMRAVTSGSPLCSGASFRGGILSCHMSGLPLSLLVTRVDGAAFHLVIAIYRVHVAAEGAVHGVECKPR